MCAALVLTHSPADLKAVTRRRSTPAQGQISANEATLLSSPLRAL